MQQQIKDLIERYESDMLKFETIKNDYATLGNHQATAYFTGRWCMLGDVICDLNALLARGGK